MHLLTQGVWGKFGNACARQTITSVTQSLISLRKACFSVQKINFLERVKFISTTKIWQFSTPLNVANSRF